MPIFITFILLPKFRYQKKVMILKKGNHFLYFKLIMINNL